ncbi:unnamed protein product [Chrysoparadoxa australica]
MESSAATSMASTAAKSTGKKLKDIARNARDGPLSIRYAGMIGALALIIISFIGFFGEVWSIDPVNACVQLYLFVFGFPLLFVELGPRAKCVPKVFFSRVYEYAKFLTVCWGRGFFYFFCGTLALAQWNLMDVILAVYLMVLGIGMLYFGSRGMKELKAIRAQLVSEDDLREKFKEYDVDKNGCLDPKELAQFCQDLGAKLTNHKCTSSPCSPSEPYHPPLQTLLLSSEDGGIQYEEFLRWWLTEKYAPKV